MDISRRGFLGGLAAGAGLLSGSAHAAGSAQFTGKPGRLGVLHDSTLCVGCRECEVGCKEVQGLPPIDVPLEDTSVFDKKRRTSEKDFTVVNQLEPAQEFKPAAFYKHQCMHCNEPVCVSVCFVKCLTKSHDGPVVYDADTCVGCRYCIMACPYDALAYEYDEPFKPRVMGCNMCYEPRIKKGLDPGCVASCPTDALVFGEREDMLKLARERIRKHPGRYIDHVYGEHEFGGTAWLTISGVPFSKLGLDVNASHAPIQQAGSSFLSMVPLVVAIFPGLLAGFHAFSERKEQLAKDEQEAAVAEALGEAAEATEAGKTKGDS